MLRNSAHLLLWILLWTLLPAGNALALAPEPPAGTAAEAAPAATDEGVVGRESLGYVDAVVLGVVEGITEYLPISSTGHLILTNQALGLNDPNRLVMDEDGSPVMGADGKPLLLGDLMNAYSIVIQAGAIAAVMILYWRRLLEIVKGIFGKSREGLLLARNLIAAFLPAAVFGLLLDDWIEENLLDVRPVVLALAVGAFFMLGAEWWRQRNHPKESDFGPELHELSVSRCLVIGFLQCIAMWPGTSRSMMTIVGGYLVGLSPKRAAEFSFLLGLITLGAASAYTGLKHFDEMRLGLDIGPVIVGMVVATVTAALAVRWLVHYLSKHGLAVFAWYRLALALLVVLALGF